MPRYYGTSNTYSVAHAAFSNELRLDTTGPGTGSTTEEVRKNSGEGTHLWTGPQAGTGVTGYSNAVEQSVDLSAFPSGLSLTTGIETDDDLTIIVTDGGAADVDSVVMGSWSSTTGTGIKTRSYASGSFDAGTFATSDEVSFGISVANSDTKNNLDTTVDFSSDDTWVEITANVTGSVTADAIVKAAVSGSFTADAVIAKASGSDDISLQPAPFPATQTNHIIKVRARCTAGTGNSIGVALYEGASNRSGDLTQVVTNALADYEVVIGDTEAATVTSYEDLEVKVWGVSITGATTFHIDVLGLSIPPGTRTTSFTADAWFAAAAGGGSGDFTADAVIKATQTGSVTADAIQLRTFYFGSGPDPR